MSAELPNLTFTDHPLEHTIELQWWGEDGEYLAAPGHLDLELFAELADAEYRRQTGEVDPLSVDFPAEHKWYVLKPYESDDGDEAYFPCEAGTPGALAFTVIETGA
jgi:hypothetical protein